jgi:hypothetical protein
VIPAQSYLAIAALCAVSKWLNVRSIAATTLDGLGCVDTARDIFDEGAAHCSQNDPMPKDNLGIYSKPRFQINRHPLS